MEAWRRNAMCFALLVLLVVVSSQVSIVEAGDCWAAEDHAMCLKPGPCRLFCQSRGKIDGRCNAGYYMVWPICECLAAHCA